MNTKTNNIELCLGRLYEKLLKLELNSPEYKQCMAEISGLEYRGCLGKTPSGKRVKEGKDTNKWKFLKGTF